MKRTFWNAGGTVLLALLYIASGRAQMTQPQAPASASTPQAPAQAPPPSNGPSGQLPSGQAPSSGQPAAQVSQPVNKQEETDYKAFFDAQGTPAQQIKLGEAFVQKYPSSRYLSSVYSRLALDYLGSGDSSEGAKIVPTAQKAVDLDPDNVDALSLIVWATGRTVNPSDPGALDTFAKIENYGHHAIALLATLVKPAELDDARFAAAKNDDLSMCHSGLGIIDFKLGQDNDSVAELTQAVQLADSADPVDYFVLGHADENVGHFADAVSAFTKCSDTGPMVDRCKAGLADANAKALTAPPPAQPKP